MDFFVVEAFPRKLVWDHQVSLFYSQFCFPKAEKKTYAFWKEIVSGLATTVETKDGRKVLFGIPQSNHRPAINFQAEFSQFRTINWALPSQIQLSILCFPSKNFESHSLLFSETKRKIHSNFFFQTIFCFWKCLVQNPKKKNLSQKLNKKPTGVVAVHLESNAQRMKWSNV